MGVYIAYIKHSPMDQSLADTVFFHNKSKTKNNNKIHKTQIVFVFKKVCLIRQKLNLSLQCLILHQIVKTCAIHTMACAADTRNNNSISKRDHFHTWKYFCQKKVHYLSAHLPFPCYPSNTTRCVFSLAKKEEEEEKKERSKIQFSLTNH